MRTRRTGAAIVGAAVLLCLMAVVLASAQYKPALPGYRYTFPRDYFNHPDFQTEWWYYTGNVKSAGGHRFGFELTFFRRGVDRDSKATGPWDVRDLYVAHLALSDLDGGEFLHFERTNRAGPGIAGASEPQARIWNGNWQVTWRADVQSLQAIAEKFSIRFTLRSQKPPVIHGKHGVSQKANGPGRASHYISLTRLNTAGQIDLNGESFQVAGTTWMDHEFFTHQLNPDQVGWDWLSIQLADNSELMLFRIRRADGSIDPFSAGTFVDARGNTIHLSKSDFTMEPEGLFTMQPRGLFTMEPEGLATMEPEGIFTRQATGLFTMQARGLFARPQGLTWTSPATHATYPLRWRIAVPKLNIALECSTPLPSQELTSSAEFVPAYWEGAVVLHGTRGGTDIGGVGYLELTGYDHPIEALR